MLEAIEVGRAVADLSVIRLGLCFNSFGDFIRVDNGIGFDALEDSLASLEGDIVYSSLPKISYLP